MSDNASESLSRAATKQRVWRNLYPTRNLGLVWSGYAYSSADVANAYSRLYFLYVREHIDEFSNLLVDAGDGRVVPFGDFVGFAIPMPAEK